MKVVLEKRAAKYLENLEPAMKHRINEALKNLAKEPPSGDILKLQGKVIETDLTDEEKKWVRKGRKHYKEHPEDFVSLESIQ